MKRLSEKHWKWLNRHAVYRNQRRRQAIIRENQRRKLFARSGKIPFNPYRVGRRRPAYHLSAPADLSLSRNYEAVVELFQNIRERALRDGKSVYVDLTGIKYISPAATLILVAELDRWRKVRNLRLQPLEIEYIQPDVLYSLMEMGFFEVLGTNKKKLPVWTERPSGPRVIRFCSGAISDLEAADQLSTRLLEVSGRNVAAGQLQLNDAIAEAMTNSVQHAYPVGHQHTLPVITGQWWVTGSYDEARGLLTVLIYDQGVGIPNTLPASRLWERIAQRINKLPGVGEMIDYEAILIEAAIEEGRTSTDVQGRGLGLAEMAQLVNNHPGCHLRIISGRGEVIFTSGQEPVRHNHALSLGGTLIEIGLTLEQ